MHKKKTINLEITKALSKYGIELNELTRIDHAVDILFGDANIKEKKLFEHNNSFLPKVMVDAET